MAVLSLTQLALAFSFLWIAWKFFKGLVVKSPLNNIPGPPPKSFLLGNLPEIFNRWGWDFHKQICQYGTVIRLHSMPSWNDMLFVYDPKALHSIIVKDQYVYEETPIFLQFNKYFFGEGLLSSVGEQHRHQRKLLNPVFHINHMRYMTPIFYKVTYRLRNGLTNLVSQGPKEVDVINWMTRTALELVGQGGVGWSFDDLAEDVKNPFAEEMKALVPTTGPLFMFVRLLPYLSRIGSGSFRAWALENLPVARIRKVKKIADSIDNQVNEILKAKKAALAKGDEALLHQIGEGKDILSVLLKANMAASEEDKMPDSELHGHMAQLLFAAMDTTSGALSHILHMLAEHQDVQERLRKEITDAQRSNDGDIPYDQLVSLPYLEAVCRETLRVHPPVLSLNRRTREDIIMPLSRPIVGKDGASISEIPIPKGTDIMIGILAANTNKEYWGEDADEWNPERFLKPLPDSIVDAHMPGIYSNMMTFLGGGRACIGFKFSQLEMKVVLSILVSTFKFELPKQEIYWNFGGLQFPTMGKSAHEKPQMYLKVSLANAKS
ncbi:cytochrome P450 [Abortiporus biennis]|nr:cytochrome P450 [Abortiporus biennis]